jgi:hypothetical protein
VVACGESGDVPVEYRGSMGGEMGLIKKSGLANVRFAFARGVGTFSFLIGDLRSAGFGNLGSRVHAP